ncbi:MAG: hypothetical protein DRH90_13095 [Deltaproteobacteria bacterium]|nr:MAG: hypothetical protein DRH90_13095 [Deltaproteobacteria bacterium]
MLENKAVLSGHFNDFNKEQQELIWYTLKLCWSGEILILVDNHESLLQLKEEDDIIVPEIERIEKIRDYVNDWKRKYREYPRVTIRLFDTKETTERLIEEFYPDLLIVNKNGGGTNLFNLKKRWPILIRN